MYKLNLYVFADPRIVQSSPKTWYYCLEYKIHRVYGSGSGSMTWHNATLRAIVAGLSRLTQNCEVRIHTEDPYVSKNMTGTFTKPSCLMKWAEHDFRKDDGEEVANAEEWRQIWKKTGGHSLIAVQIGPEDRKWLEAISQEHN